MTDKEVDARVEFKLNQILESVKNIATTNWHLAFKHNSQKHTHYWEAFSQLESIIKKEAKMAPPFDEMAEQKRRLKRDKAIDKIMESFCDKGDRDYHRKLRLLVSIIEDAQYW